MNATCVCCAAEAPETDWDLPHCARCEDTCREAMRRRVALGRALWRMVDALVVDDRVGVVPGLVPMAFAEAWRRFPAAPMPCEVAS